MPSYPVSINICDSVELCRSAVNKLQQETILLVDCEGVQLGTKGGSLSMIGLAPIVSKDDVLQVYLLDACKVPFADIGIEPLLANANINKIMFDCRMDAMALP